MGRIARMQNGTIVTIMALALTAPAFGLDRPAAPSDSPGRAARDRGGENIAATGTVAHIDLEGGFWGIIGDDGKRYDVSNLPQGFRKEGLRVRFVGSVRPSQVSFHMWGVMVEVITLERIKGPEQ
jgi:hypothetical protein